MPAKEFELPGIGTVLLSKKRGQKYIRLRIAPDGSVRVSAPWAVPARAALLFVSTKKAWINAHKDKLTFEPCDGMMYGKDLQLAIIEHSPKLRSRSNGKTLYIYIPGKLQPSHYAYIKKAMIRSLKREAEEVLIPRLNNLAADHKYSVRSISIKQLTGRWGSCDSRSNITLSLFLVQLPWELIDYVIVHELIHTRHMNHSSGFWGAVGGIYPNYPALRKEMRRLSPRIYDRKTFMS